MAGGFDDRLPATLDSVMAAGILERAAPGGSIAVGRYGRHVLARGYGRTDWAADASTVDERTIYDLASLTKVVVTTTAAMILEETGSSLSTRLSRGISPTSTPRRRRESLSACC